MNHHPGKRHSLGSSKVNKDKLRVASNTKLAEGRRSKDGVRKKSSNVSEQRSLTIAASVATADSKKHASSTATRSSDPKKILVKSNPSESTSFKSFRKSKGGVAKPATGKPVTKTTKKGTGRRNSRRRSSMSKHSMEAKALENEESWFGVHHLKNSPDVEDPGPHAHPHGHPLHDSHSDDHGSHGKEHGGGGGHGPGSKTHLHGHGGSDVNSASHRLSKKKESDLGKKGKKGKGAGGGGGGGPTTLDKRKKKKLLRPCCCGHFHFRNCCIFFVVVHLISMLAVWIFALIIHAKELENLKPFRPISYVTLCVLSFNTLLSWVGAFILILGIIFRKRIPCLIHFWMTIALSFFMLVLAVVIGVDNRVENLGNGLILATSCAIFALIFAYAAFCSYGLAGLIVIGKDKEEIVEPLYIDDSPIDENDFVPILDSKVV